MIRLQKLKCYLDGHDWSWEGRILIQDNNNSSDFIDNLACSMGLYSFEGIIEEYNSNIYLSGYLDTMNDRMIINTSAPEYYPLDQEMYKVSRIGNSDHYEGICTAGDGSFSICHIDVEKELDQKLVESQIEELKYIINSHKDTLDERYDFELGIFYTYGTVKEEEHTQMKQKLKSQDKIHYYL